MSVADDTKAMAPEAGTFEAPLTPLRRLKSIVGGCAGNLVEWYDWFAYSAFTLYFAKVFFPQGDQTAQLLQAAAVFGVGFLMRPIGGWLMGVYSDRHGRKAGLTLSMLMMCAGSLIIAVTPGHAQIGGWAPAMLVFARLLQGLSVGGEYGASATYMSEMATRKRRGFWSSWQYVTLILGQLSALGVLIVLQRTMAPADLEAWGWRIPFFIGAALAVSVFWIRRGIDETVAFKGAAREGLEGGVRVLLKHRREAAMVVGLTVGGSLAFYAFTTYLQKYLVNTSGLTKGEATNVTAGALVVFMLLQPVAGWLSDVVGRRPMLIAFGVMGMVFTVPIFTLLGDAPSPWEAFALSTFALVIISCYSSISAVVKAELFPAHVRALGVALPYALANSVVAGTAEYVALWLKQAGSESVFYYYVAAAMGVSLLVSLRMRETRDHSRIVED